MDHYKTIETNTEPAFIVTNNSHELNKGMLLMGWHWYSGEEDEYAPRPTAYSDKALLITIADAEKLVAALNEFIDSHPTPDKEGGE